MWGGLFSEGEVIYPRTGENNRVSIEQSAELVEH
jgi:hypothetical protein